VAWELTEDAFGDHANAQMLAAAADLAYLPEAEGKAGFRELLNMDAQLIQAGNTQAYVASNDDHIVVVFRGTEGLTGVDGVKDWLLTNAVNLLILPVGDLGTDFVAAGVGTRWHQGFMSALNNIWEPVFAAVQAERKKRDRPVWLTGHSLGGALALLAAWRFKRKFVPIHQIYTFGAPMVGNQLAAQTIDREFGNKIYRYVNFQDPVPCLPTVSVMANEYGHCQKEVMLGVVGESGTAAVADASLFSQFAGRAVNGILTGTLLDEFWSHVHQRIGAHAMAKYRDHLARLFQKT